MVGILFRAAMCRSWRGMKVSNILGPCLDKRARYFDVLIVVGFRKRRVIEERELCGRNLVSGRHMSILERYGFLKFGLLKIGKNGKIWVVFIDHITLFM